MNESDPRPNRRRPMQKPRAVGQNSGNSKAAKKRAKLVGPTKAETAILPPFQGIAPDRIYIPQTQTECQRAVDEILAAGAGGFDTEAKPTFQAGQKSDGPHVVQFSLSDKAYIFQLHRSECEEATAELISSQHVLKVGFGLRNDHKQIWHRLGIALNNVLDLDQVFRKMGYRGQIGIRGAVGVLLKQRFRKSKSTTTSNWARPELSPQQLLYAANDAYAALKIMEILKAEGRL